MWASGKKQWQSGKEYAIDYLKIIENEYKLAQRTADILHHWATDKNEGPSRLNKIIFLEKKRQNCLGLP